MSREYPDYPMVGVGVVVWKDNAVLLIQRGKPPRAGTWSLPGGRQELGETTREAGVREVREETGLEVDIKDLIDVVDTIHRDDEGHVHMQYTLVDYWAEWVSGEPVAGTDAADARWVNLQICPHTTCGTKPCASSTFRQKRVSARYLSSDIGRAPRKACM